MDITKILEEELRRMLLHGEYSQDAANSQYNELMEQSRTHCDTISEQEYFYNDVVLRIGERLKLVGSTAVEKAAARQWVQYRITRLGYGINMEVLQELDDYLKDRTYLAGTQFSISDLLFYCCSVLRHYLVEITTQRLPYRYSNLVRWFDQVQHHCHHSTGNCILTVITNCNIAGPVQRIV